MRICYTRYSFERLTSYVERILSEIALEMGVQISSMLTSRGLTSQELTSQELTSQELTSQEPTSQELTSQELTERIEQR